MQTCEGNATKGFVAMEWQDWVRLAAYPKMRAYADSNFVSTEEKYLALVRATGHDIASGHKKFLVTHDQDARHSYLHHYKSAAGKKKTIDRRLLSEGQKLYIPFDIELDYVPLAMRVPDCVQSPIEMFFAPIKTQFRKIIKALRKSGQQTTPKLCAEAVLQAFEKKGTQQRVYRCWHHARKSLLVWTTPVGEWVEIDGMKVQGSGANWVHKKFSG